ncbi:MAG: hypothetical protein V4456_23275 [Bacteroidota bacterium]
MLKGLLKLILTAFLFLQVLNGNAQNTHIEIPINTKGDTSFWYKYNADLIRKFGLIDITKESDKFYFRVWHHAQTISSIVEIYQTEDSISRSSVTFFTKEIVPENENATNRYFFKTYVLENNLFTRGELTEVNIIPSEESIKGWSQGFDGVVYIIENLEGGNYSFKSYWTPAVQGDLKQAIYLKKFFNEIFDLTEIKGLFSAFIKLIPFEMYNSGGPSIAVRILTNKQRKAYRKERDAFRKQSTQ